MDIIPKKRRILSRWLFAVVFSILVIVAGVFYFKNRRQVSNWQNLEISPIHLNGVNADFAVKDGKIYKNGKEIYWILDHGEYDRVLKLALFYQWNKEDPLLFDPDLNVSTFKDSLGRLQTVDDIFSQKVGHGYPHPLPFLENFADASAAYQDFSGNISEANASALLAVMEKASDSYTQEEQRISEIFAEKNDNGSKVGYLGGQTYSSSQIARQDFQEIDKNAGVLSADMLERKACLEKGDCDMHIAFSRPASAGDPDEDTNIATLPKEDLESDQIEAGPFLVHSQCWENRNVDLMFSGEKCFGDNGCADWPFLTDDVFFVKLDSNSEGKGGQMWQQGMKERGMQSASGPYACADQTYKPKIQAIQFAMKNYAGSRLFGDDFSQLAGNDTQLLAIQNDGKIFESAFFDAKYPSDNALDNLTQYYAYTYGVLSQKNIHAAAADDFLERALALEGKTQNFDLIINRLSMHLNNYLIRYRGIDPAYSFLVWSNYSVTFLDFSPFVWKIDDSPQYLISGKELNSNAPAPTANSAYLNYQEAIGIYGTDKVQGWITQWNGTQ